MLRRKTRRTTGRHRAHPAPGTLVAADVHAALHRAVEADQHPFHPEEWTFNQSTILLTVATRLDDPQHRYVFSSDCRATRVRPGETTEDAIGRLAGEETLNRFEIEWLLCEETRFAPRRHWHLTPLPDHQGWLCGYRSRLGRSRWYVVAQNRTFIRVPDNTPETAHAALRVLLADRAHPVTLTGPAAGAGQRLNVTPLRRPTRPVPSST